MLAEHFLQIYAEKYSRNVNAFSQKSFGQMLSYNWRGNVRELQHVVERAVLLSKGNTVQELNIPASSDIPAAMSAPAGNARQISTPSFSGSANLSVSESAAENSYFPADNLFNFSDEELFEEIGKFIVNKLPEPVDGQDQKDVFDSIEYGVVLAALRRTNGNKQAAANLLGLYRPRLYGMIKRHSLEEKI